MDKSDNLIFRILILPGDEDFLATGGGVFLLLGTGDFSLSDVSLFEEELWNTDDFSVVTVSPTILRSGVLLLSLLKSDYYLNYNFNLISMFAFYQWYRPFCTEISQNISWNDIGRYTARTVNDVVFLQMLPWRDA